MEAFDLHTNACTTLVLQGLTPTAYSQYQYNHSINIDGNENNHFAIDWEDDYNDIWLNTGSIGTGNAPVLDCSVPISVTYDGKTPDVAMHDGGCCSGTEHIFVTYIATAGNSLYGTNDLVVEDEDYDYIAGPSGVCLWDYPNYDLDYVYTGSFIYSNPRIAANGAGYDPLWTVVFEESDGSNNYISGWTYNPNISAVPVQHYYNDASSNSPGEISDAPNNKPVVSYANGDESNIYIGWTFNNVGPVYTFNSTGAKNAIYPIVLYLDNAGELECNSTYDGKYWEVPNDVSNNGSPPDNNNQTLSLASRFDRTYLLCTYNNYDANTSSNNDVFYKLPYQNVNGLKQETAGGVSDIAPLFSPNPFNTSTALVPLHSLVGLTDLQLTVSDIMGRTIFTIHGNASSLNKNLSSLSSALESGIYLFKISSPTNEQQWLQKMVKL
jgi:hypothetical protein